VRSIRILKQNFPIFLQLWKRWWNS